MKNLKNLRIKLEQLEVQTIIYKYFTQSDNINYEGFKLNLILS